MAQARSSNSRAQARLTATGEQAEWWQCRSIAGWTATPRNTMAHFRPGFALGFALGLALGLDLALDLALGFALGLALDRWEKP